MSNVGFSISRKDTSTCSSALPGAGIWTSDLPITSRPALPAELQLPTMQMSMCILTYKTYTTEQVQLNSTSTQLNFNFHHLRCFKSCNSPLVKSKHAAADVSDWLKNETYESTSSRILGTASPMFSFCFYRELITHSGVKLDVMQALKKGKLSAKVVL